ncbi:hypothetical protein [Hymenobacter sp. BRD67]|uniref:hypothetical protein n=1 Tax=Hymenobacter sp. BRD67 TaxID=2675877 RepID=UPI001566DB04|nr:hypothetical protein [Hymenobacter sp. BRD67]QKG54280.1 hypothetical protein GKZ67_18875 [Hymenobacter sp. BRD67]
MKTFLIDDDPLANYLTERLLRIEQFSTAISTFESAEAALAMLLQQPRRRRRPLFSWI